jgi:Holliday junction resolvase
MSNFGHARERQVKKLLEEEGWFVIRAPGSLGVADLVAVRKSAVSVVAAYGIDANISTVRFIEVKGNEQGGPYMNFRPSDRQALIDAAEKAGARAELAYWPKRGNLVWIDSEAWPK